MDSCNGPYFTNFRQELKGKAQVAVTRIIEKYRDLKRYLNQVSGKMGLDR